MDPVNDNNPVPLFRADAVCAFPAWVGDEDMLSPESVAHLNKSAFADPARREFPIHTKVATFLSYAYALGAGDVAEPIIENIEKAAAAWGIENDLLPYAEGLTGQTKEASAPGAAFGLVVGNSGYFPCGDADETAASIRSVCRSFSAAGWNPGLSGSQIKQAAVNLAEVAEQQGADIPEILQRIRFNLPDRDTAVKYASVRPFMTGCDVEMGELYKEAAAAIATASAEEIDDCLDAWLELDRAKGIKYAGTRIPSPWHAFFAGPTEQDIEKVARANVFLGAVPVPAMLFAGLDNDTIRAHFAGEDFETIKEACAKAANDAFGASQDLIKLAPDAAGRLSTLLLASA